MTGDDPFHLCLAKGCGNTPVVWTDTALSQPWGICDQHRPGFVADGFEIEDYAPGNGPATLVAAG